MAEEQSRCLNIKTLQEAVNKHGASAGAISNTDDCKRIWNFLKWFGHHDEFYIEVNINKPAVTRTYGIEKWLQQADIKDQPRSNFTQYVHPFIRDWYEAFTEAALLVLLERTTHEFLKSRFVINVPLQKGDGKVMLVKQITMPFGLDKDNKIVSFITACYIVDTYRGEPLKLTVHDGNKRVGMFNETNFSIEEKLQSLIQPCMNFTRETRIVKNKGKDKTVKYPANLTVKHFDVTNTIRQIKRRTKDFSTETIAEILNSRKNKALRSGSYTKYLNEIKSHVKWMFYYEEIHKQRHQDNVKYLLESMPKVKDSFPLIEFIDESGILDLLEWYYLRSGKHDPAS